MAYRLRSCLVGRHVVAQHLAHARHFGSGSSQICRRLEGAHTCLGHKVVRVDQNTSVDTVCLMRLQLDILGKILQHLRDHLAGARRIRLYIGKHRILDDLAALSVMVKHAHRIRAF